MQDPLFFAEARSQIKENLESLQTLLLEARYKDQAKQDYLQELEALLTETQTADYWSPLQEIVFRGRLLETSIGAWASRQGLSALSLQWPSI